MSFVDDLHGFGDRLAVVTPGGARLSYRDLATRVSDVAQRLGDTRRLVLVAAGTDIDPLVTYLAALRGGHPVLLTTAQDQRRLDALIDTYDPDVVAAPVAGSWRLDERRRGSAHVLQPELALLLSTSGSTGSPKLARLSATNVTANATAIAEYLDIRDTDRAAVSLPMHYCYGLSVINSNLLRGAALLLSDHSVTDPQFWSAFREHGGTSLHGVPYTFELLDRVGFPEMTLPHLRYVTQAGGRLAPDTVRRYAELGARRGWALFVMYGQTEATARMAYLPPELAAANPSAIGIPIPGGSFDIEPSDGADSGEGELVYRGPNVMLGYAENPADLARGRTVEALRTGDLARCRPDGLYEVVGRRNRFIKPFGLRVDLDQVERLLEDEGVPAACTGTDDELIVTVAREPDPSRVRRLVADRLTLPAGRVRVVTVDELPRRPNGKIDHRAVAELARAEREQPGRLLSSGRRRPKRARTVHDAFRTVFGDQDLPDDATFVSLGGDSLSYVQMTTELEHALGRLPDDWPTTPLRRLAQLQPHRHTWSRMETAVALRAAAIVLVVGSHVGLFYLLGGAHVLLAVAGWAFARFVLVPEVTEPSRSILRGLTRIAVPSALWIAWRAMVQDDVDLPNALLVNYVIDPAAWGYWYVEALVQALLLLAVVFAVPAVRRLERAYPFGFAVLALLVTLAGRLFPDTGNEFSDRLFSTHLVVWLFVLGWVVHRATTAGQRAATAVLVVVLVPSFFDDPLRGTVVAGGVLLLLLVPHIPLPRLAVRPIGAVAAASLSIYLTHYAVYPLLLAHLPPLLVLATCLAVGIVIWWAVTTTARHWRATYRACSRRAATAATTGAGDR